jgi:hypothetical protein
MAVVDDRASITLNNFFLFLCAVNRRLVTNLLALANFAGSLAFAVPRPRRKLRSALFHSASRLGIGNATFKYRTVADLIV